MNWDKEWLNASKQRRRSGLASLQRRQSESQGQGVAAHDLLDQFMQSTAFSDESITTPTTARRHSFNAKVSKDFTDVERVAIKRRKVGKFIGLIGMDTPNFEIDGRLRDVMERAIERGREELRQNELWFLRRSKMG